MGFVLRASLAVLLAAVIGYGCFEIPPTVPEDYVGGEPAEGWPPPRVYHPDRFHPANRLFQRLFVLECDAPCGDVAFPGRRAFSALDVAELVVLLSRTGAATASGGDAPEWSETLPPSGLRLLEADLRALAGFLRARDLPGDASVARLLDGLRSRMPKGRLARAPAIPPPPGGVEMEHGPALAGPLPAAHPLPLASDLEWWRLEGAPPQGAAAAVYQLRRERWLAGSEGWARLDGEASIVVKAPEDASEPGVRIGTIMELCGNCHGPG
jgi:hypothetical protein